jgi:hypothetical protein
MIKKLVTVTLVLFHLISCSSNKGPVSDKDDGYWDPNLKNKIEKARDQGGGIFGNIGKKDTNTTVDFAKSNILWKATIKSLEFLPLINADYSGGIIIYDWYSLSEKPKEQIKVTVQFLDNELRTESIKILAHKKICENFNNCSNSVVDEDFSNSIKSSIISAARILKIEEAKKDKK